MKSVFLLFFLTVSCFCFSQASISATPRFTFSSHNFNPFEYVINLKSKNYLDKNNLSIYNKTTDLTDNFTKVSGKYYFSNAKFDIENSNRGVKIDSFNPNGAFDIAGAVFAGLFNTLFDTKVKIR